jgi:nucleoside-diphosphate-sugar epimerase
VNNYSVIVTGGGGFLGSHLVEKLLNDGYYVIAIDNFCTGDRKNLEYLKQNPNHQSLKFIENDCTNDWPSMLGDTKNLKWVFHMASPASPPLYQKMPLETLRVNSTGLKEALMYASPRKARVIFASTSEVYGDAAEHPQPESYWGNVNSFGPRACYDEAKRFGEALLYSWNQVHGTSHGLVRIFNTYGPRMNPYDGRVVINFLKQLIEHKPLTVYGEGKQTRSFCYVSDLVDGILAYAKSTLSEPVNLGNPNEFSILELAKEVQGLDPEQSLPLKFSAIPVDDPKQRQPDITKAKKLLNWSPKVELQDGLKIMHKWLKTALKPQP